MDKNSILLFFIVFIIQKKGLLSQTVPEQQLTLAPPVRDVLRKVNESLIVTCQSPSSVSDIHWKSPANEKIVANKGRIHVEETPRGLALIFDSIERNDKGNYTCNAVAGEAKMRIAFNLITIKPIVFRRTPDVQNATEFQNFIVQCEADGDPAPNIFWFINGTESPEAPKQKPIAKGLYITNVSLEDRGMYECRAMQMATYYADMSKKTIQLKVFHKPKWKLPNQTNQELAYGYLSGVVNLTCEAIADPEPQFTWRRNNVVIQPEHHNATVINEPQRSILQLPVHNQSTFGEYKCEANNSIGRVERIIILQEGVKPNPPKEIEVKETTVHTAAMEIMNNQHEDGIIGYRVQFVIKQPGIQHTWDAPDYQDFMKETGSVSKTSVLTIIDLLENTEYAVRVASRNAAGLSDFTDELRFRTKSSTTSDVASVNQSSCNCILFVVLYLIYLIH